MSLFKRKTTRWERKPDEIARRIEAKDVARDFATKPFVVFDGTVALVFTQGRCVGTVESGMHDIDGPLRRWLSGDDPTTLVMIDDGELTFDLNVEGLYSSENIALSVALRFRMRLDSPEAFHRNVMRDRTLYRRDDLERELAPDLVQPLLELTSTRMIEELYRAEDFAADAVSRLQPGLASRLESLGFAIEGLDLVRTSSPAFDEVRGEQGAQAVQERRASLEESRVALLKRVRESRALDEKHEARTESELADVVAQASHELGLKNTLRSDELARLEARVREDLLDVVQQRTLDRSGDAREHARDEERRDLDLRLDARIEEAEAKARENDVARETAEKDWELARRVRDDALAAKKRKDLDAVEVREREIEALSRADTATKIALGVGDSEALLELERLDRESSMSEDQLLIKAAERSPEVAAALAERFRAEGRLDERLLDQVQRQLTDERTRSREHAAQLERVMREALQRMGDVASEKARSGGPGDQTIIASGSGASVVDPRKHRKSSEDVPDADGGPDESPTA